MTIQCYSLGQMQANCYFIIEENKCLIIDPADEANFILEKLQREKLELVGMIATHGHFDHIMAAGGIQLSLDVPFYIHKKDSFLVKRLNETAKYFLGFDPAALPPKKIEFLQSGELKIKNFKLKILNTPGHTPGSISVISDRISDIGSKNSRRPKQHQKRNLTTDDRQLKTVVFTGDTLFKQGIGRYDFSYSDKKLLDQSLTTLFKLPEDTIVYPGHGEATMIGEEAKNMSKNV